MKNKNINILALHPNMPLLVQTWEVLPTTSNFQFASTLKVWILGANADLLILGKKLKQNITQ